MRAGSLFNGLVWNLCCVEISEVNPWRWIYCRSSILENRNESCTVLQAVMHSTPRRTGRMQLPLKWNIVSAKANRSTWRNIRSNELIRFFFVVVVSTFCRWRRQCCLHFCWYCNRVFFLLQILWNGQFQSRRNRRLKTKGRHATRRRRDCELQTREPNDVCLGNTRSITCGRYLLAGQCT